MLQLTIATEGAFFWAVVTAAIFNPSSGKLVIKDFPDFGIFWILDPLVKKKKNRIHVNSTIFINICFS
jgi:hypothetical protein